MGDWSIYKDLLVQRVLHWQAKLTEHLFCARQGKAILNLSSQLNPASLPLQPSLRARLGKQDWD